MREAVKNGVARSLILLDACRERLIKDRRNRRADPRSVATFFLRDQHVNGQRCFLRRSGRRLRV